MLVASAVDALFGFSFSAMPSASGIKSIAAVGLFAAVPTAAALAQFMDEFCARLLEKEKLAAVSGTGFGADGYLRLSYATNDEVIKPGVARIAQFAATLGK